MHVNKNINDAQTREEKKNHRMKEKIAIEKKGKEYQSELTE